MFKEFLADVKEILPIIQLAGWITLFVLVGVVGWWRKRAAESYRLTNRQAFEHTEVMLFGLFGKVVRHQSLGTVPTVTFGEAVTHCIVGWNDHSSPDLIEPPDSELADRIWSTINQQGMALLCQSLLVRWWFNGVALLGDEHYRYVEVVAFLVRPDHHKMGDWQDCPRIILVEKGVLAQMKAMDADMDTQDKAHETWREVLRQMLERVQSGAKPVKMLKVALGPAS